MSKIKRLILNKKEILKYKELSINSFTNVIYNANAYYYRRNTKVFNFNISEDYKKLFMDTFGKVDYCYTTWYRSYNWFVMFKNAVFTVSSSVRGTSYYLVDIGNNTDVDMLCYSFCIEMDKFLKELNKK